MSGGLELEEKVLGNGKGGNVTSPAFETRDADAVIPEFF